MADNGRSESTASIQRVVSHRNKGDSREEWKCKLCNEEL